MSFRIPSIGPLLSPAGANPHNQPIIETLVNIDPLPLPIGIPVYLAANGNNDGISVITPFSAATGNTNNGFAIGITTAVATPGQPVDCVVKGLHLAARVTLQTRSASTAAWASWPAIAIGDALTPETVNNGLSRLSIGTASAVLAYFYAMAPFASSTTAASSLATGSQTVAYTVFTTQSGTNSTAPTTLAATATYTISTVASALFVTSKVFVRAM